MSSIEKRSGVVGFNHLPVTSVQVRSGPNRPLAAAGHRKSKQNQGSGRMKAQANVAVVRSTSLGSLQVEQLTCSIGAELRNVNLGAAVADDELFQEIRSLLLKHRVLFFRDQDITRAEHVGFARRFGELEDHPVAGSDPEHPGLVRIYKSPDAAPEHYENAFHCDATWRAAPPFGSVLRCVEGPEVGGDTIWVNMALAYERLPERIKEQIA